LDQFLNYKLELVRRALIAQLVVLVEGVLGVRDRDLLRDDERAAADRQYLAQREQRLHAAGAAGGSGAEREDAVLIGGKRRLAALAHGRDPVDGVLEQRRDRGIVLGAGDEHAPVRRHDLLELQRIERRPRLRREVGVVDRQRIVGKRDARDLGRCQQQFL